MNKKSIAKVLIILSVILIVISISDFINLHEIMKNYVSPDLISKIGIPSGLHLPTFTATENAWMIVSMGLYLKISIMAAMAILSYLLLRDAI